MSELTTEQATEQIAKEISRELYGNDAVWELCLSEAYTRYYDLSAKHNNVDKEK